MKKGIISLLLPCVVLFCTCGTSSLIKKTIYNKGNGEYLLISNHQSRLEGTLIRDWSSMQNYIGYSGFYVLCDIKSRKWMCYDSTDVLQFITQVSMEVDKNLLNKIDKKGNKVETYVYLGNGLFEYSHFKSGEKQIIDTLDLIPKVELDSGCNFVD